MLVHCGSRPPYVVRFGDGHTQFVYPGPDAVVLPGEPSG
ncbi:DUF1918 domain-containing protein [Nonomuraea wenchangensis]